MSSHVLDPALVDLRETKCQILKYYPVLTFEDPRGMDMFYHVT